MCGIAGALDLEGRRDFPPERLARMARALRHRGPDDAASFVEPGVAMAVQRLAVTDPEGGRQPRADAGGRVWVSHNGELFEADALRAALEARGHRFTSRCDTELWPALYLDAGAGAFARARGQYAVALWDRAERRLLLGRDRAGICPLYWARAEGWLLWGSEIKALLASGLVAPELDEHGVDTMFSLFAAGPRRTCFRGVSAIAPGHYVEAGAEGVREVRYWELDFPRAGEERRGDPDALADELGACLEGAVARRRAADAPVATYLSGGLDSALITALACKGDPTRRPAFTLGLDGAGPDERARAGEVARHCDVPWRLQVADGPGLVRELPGATLAAESPILDMANACTLRLAASVRSAGCKVVLTGEGADETLAGYVWHAAQRVAAPLAAGLPRLERGLRALVARATTPGTPPSPLGASLGDLRPVQLDLWDPMARARALFYSDDAWARLGARDALEELALPAERMRGWHPLHRGLYLDFTVMLPGHLLQGKGDRVAMQSGVECRYPFLDEAFVALAASLAPELKLRGLRGKWLLRRYAAHVLPPPLARPPKTMFKARSLCQLGPLPDWVAELVSPASLARTGLFSSARVAREERLQRVLPASHPRRFVADAAYTAVITTQLWHHLYLGGGLCSLPRWTAPAP